MSRVAAGKIVRDTSALTAAALKTHPSGRFAASIKCLSDHGKICRYASCRRRFAGMSDLRRAGAARCRQRCADPELRSGRSPCGSRRQPVRREAGMARTLWRQRQAYAKPRCTPPSTQESVFSISWSSGEPATRTSNTSSTCGCPGGLGTTSLRLRTTAGSAGFAPSKRFSSSQSDSTTRDRWSFTAPATLRSHGSKVSRSPTAVRSDLVPAGALRAAPIGNQPIRQNLGNHRTEPGSRICRL